jgi:putative GTP pyrophosphokinase
MDKKSEIEEKAIEWYISNQNTYKKLALKVENIVKEILDINEASYHIVTCRAKDIDSFKKKIAKEKYDDPINQITDLAGIRVITYVEDEVEQVCKLIEGIFNIDKDRSLDKSTELGVDKVGYKSVHYVAMLKQDRLKLPEYQAFKNKYFEIQVRTILQHAWAEIEHDRNYKFSGKLPIEIQRRFKLLAGSLEISDREFNNISKEIDKVSKEIELGTKEGKLDFEVNSTSIRQYLGTKFIKLKESGFPFINTDDPYVIKELEDYGIKTLEELDKIIPKDFIKVFLESEEESPRELALIALVRMILIINDYNRYFSNSWKGKWQVWSNKGEYEKIFKHYSIDWDKINENYKVPFMDKP